MCAAALKSWRSEAATASAAGGSLLELSCLRCKLRLLCRVLTTNPDDRHTSFRIFLSKYDYEILEALDSAGKPVYNSPAFKTRLYGGDEIIAPPKQLRAGLPIPVGDLRVRLTPRKSTL